MRAVKTTVHNYRSIAHAQIALDTISLVAGANNAGKSNLIDAIRTFYGDLKWEKDRDVPMFPMEGDTDSWIEIEYKPTQEELSQLKDEYRSADGTFTVRNYFVSGQSGPDGKPRIGYYAYIDGELSDTLFYGAKNVGSGKFGKIIYIPAVSKLEDHTKMSGPSALRELITTVLGNVIADSPVYAHLTEAFDEFEQDIKAEKSEDGHSLKKLESEIADELSGWSTGFEFDIQEIQPSDLIKTLVKPSFVDKEHGQPVDQSRFGAGFQRNLIYSLIKLAAKYARPAKAPAGKKEFSPALNWILFDHAVLFDADSGGSVDVAVAESIDRSKSEYTHVVHSFPHDLEEFLGIPKCADARRKPQHLLYHLEAGSVQEQSIKDTVALLSELCRPLGAK